ncbi:MAG: 3-keto-5-aminohexanoate cleavage protein [Actinobacteria bacterium]|nr:3-keto-5-aminohexanoate cleavage protein [Actinomycetota bacterium]
MSSKGEVVIVSCAVTGAMHVPAQTPHLPVTPEQIAAAAVGAAGAGAAILHLHARDPEDGRPTADPEVFARFLPEIAAGCDAVINLSTGGGQGMPMDRRLAAVRRFAPELCSLNMGSLNFGTFPLLRNLTEFVHDWERPYIEETRDYVFKNTFADIEAIVAGVGALGTRFELECYDVGHLYTVAHFLEAGVLKPPLFLQAVMGVLGGIAAEATNLMHMKAVADRLFGDDYLLSVIGAGRHQTRLATQSALLGGHVRVGLEDSIYLERGRLAETNAQQVEKIVRILRELSMEPASPAEARRMLALKGAGATAIAA